MDLIDNGLFTNTLNQLIDLCGRNSIVFDSGYTLLMKLMIPIDFCFAILMNMLSFGGNGYISLMFSKIMRYGFWIWFFRNWDMIINAVIKSLTRAGAGFGSLDAGIVERPSEILNYGFKYAGQFMDSLNKSPVEVGHIGQSMLIWIISLIAFVGIFVAFAYIALNAFITVMEFKIVSALLLLFVPFAVNDRTSRYAENALGFILGTGVKMMMMAAIISLSINAATVLDSKISMKVGDGGIVGWQDAFSALLLAWIFAFLAVQIPSIAAGAMSGAPSLSGAMAQSAAMGAAATMGGAIGASMGGGGSLARGASALGGLASGAAGAAARGNASFASTFAKGAMNMATSGMQNTFDNAQGATEAKFGEYHPRNVGTASTAATKRENNAMDNTTKQESKGNGTGN